jgi:hypothetical protein
MQEGVHDKRADVLPLKVQIGGLVIESVHVCDSSGTWKNCRVMACGLQRLSPARFPWVSVSLSELHEIPTRLITTNEPLNSIKPRLFSLVYDFYYYFLFWAGGSAVFLASSIIRFPADRPRLCDKT